MVVVVVVMVIVMEIRGMTVAPRVFQLDRLAVRRVQIGLPPVGLTIIDLRRGAGLALDDHLFERREPLAIICTIGVFTRFLGRGAYLR